MVSSPAKQAVLLPVKPQYALPIMDGTKTVEFRKAGFKEPVSHVVVYASSPIKRVVGYFEISAVHEGTPRQIWERFGKCGVINRDDFMLYYRGREKAVAIEVGKVVKLKRNVPLSSVCKCKAVPQSFAYLPPQALAKLAKH